MSRYWIPSRAALCASILALLLLAGPGGAAQNVSAPGGVAAGRDVTNSTINFFGLSPEQVQELTKAAAAGAVGPLADRIIELSNRLGVTQGATLSMLRVLGERDVPLEQLPQKLAEVATQFQKFQAPGESIAFKAPFCLSAQFQKVQPLLSRHLRQHTWRELLREHRR